MTHLAALSLDLTHWGVLACAAIALGLAVVLVVYMMGLRDQERSATARAVLLTLRLAAIGVVLFSLAHPTWVRQIVTEHKPIVAVVLDTSGSMAQPVDPSRKESPTRFDLARGVLINEVLPKLTASHDVRVYDVDGAALDITKLPAKPEGNQSPIARTLLRIDQQLQGQPVSGVVLLSDGAETLDVTGSSPLERMSVAVSPIQIVQPTTQPASPDLLIAGVTANRRALVGNTVKVSADLVASGAAEGTTVPVTITDGDKVVARSTVTFKPGQPTTRAELEFTPRRAGEFTFSVQLGAATGERDLSNNRATFPLTVRAKALTVLYIDGVLRWEGKFVRQTLSSDPDVNVVSSIRTTGSTDRGSTGLLLAEQLEKIDVVVLGDIEVTHFSAREIEALKEWVTQRGGGLLVTGGYKSFGSEGLGRSELRTILPVEFSAAANPQIEQPFNLQLTDAGRQSPIFHLSGDRAKDTAFYQSLPPLDGCSRVAGVKPGAQILATNAQVRGPDGAALPVMIVQEIGAGRSMVFAVDTTWKWRMVVGGFTGDDSFYRRFWGQLVRWMATGQEEATLQRVSVSTDHARYALGQKVRVRVELHPQQAGKDIKPGTKRSAIEPAPVSELRVSAKAIDEAGAQADVKLTESPAAAGGVRVFEGSVAANSPGRLDLMVIAEPQSPTTQSAAPGAVGGAESRVVSVNVERTDSESIDPRPNPRFLQMVARATTGRVYELGQIDELVTSLPRNGSTSRSVSSVALGYHPALGALLLTLLCAEWIVRRSRKLA